MDFQLLHRSGFAAFSTPPLSLPELRFFWGGDLRNVKDL